MGHLPVPEVEPGNVLIRWHPQVCGTDVPARRVVGVFRAEDLGGVIIGR